LLNGADQLRLAEFLFRSFAEKTRTARSIQYAVIAQERSRDLRTATVDEAQAS